MACRGSITREKITALTLTDPLSRVMTSWGWTSRAIVRRLTLTIRSTTGISRMSPGPFAPMRRPSRKMTPRSYSRRILIAEERKIRRMIKAGTVTTSISIVVSAPGRDGDTVSSRADPCCLPPYWRWPDSTPPLEGGQGETGGPAGVDVSVAAEDDAAYVSVQILGNFGLRF